MRNTAQPTAQLAFAETLRSSREQNGSYDVVQPVCGKTRFDWLLEATYSHCLGRPLQAQGSAR